MKNKQLAWLAAGAIIAASALSALAHGGATGIVKDRMDGMSAMGDAVKSLSDMFRSGEYNAELVSEGAEAILVHSGEQLTSLFPVGTGGEPSEAKPEIWADFEDFSAIAMQLDLAATALKANAANPQVEGPSSTDLMGGDMMGESGMGASAMGTNAMGAQTSLATAEMFAEMPQSEVFNFVVRTCAECHTKYRFEK